MIIRLPHIEQISTEQLPNNFDDLVRESFAKFTQGTSKYYRFVDKLLYLDNLRKYYTTDFKYDYDAVKKIMTNYFEFKIDEFEEFPDERDFLSTEFMEVCFKEGFFPLRRYYDLDSSSRNDRVQKTILRIIQLVVNYEE